MSATERYGFDLVGDLARAAEELDAAFAGAWAPNLKTMVQATRIYGYFGGPELQLDGTIDWFVNGTVVCPDNVLSLVQRQRFTGTVIAASPAVLQDGYRPMAVARCVSGNLIRFVDARDSVLGTGARLLDDLEDVSLYDLQDADFLRWDQTLGVWVNVPASAGSAIEVQKEDSTVVPAATALNFEGSGVNVVEDPAGIARIVIPGSGGSGGGGYPTGPLPDPAIMGVLYDASDVAGVTDGNGMSSWPNQGAFGSGKDLENTGGSVRPTYRLSDSEDGLPFVEFDGTDDFLRKTAMTPYTGSELTFFLVSRAGNYVNQSRIFALTKITAVDTNNAGTIAYQQVAGGGAALYRQTAAKAVTSVASSGAEFFDDRYTWQALAGRYKVVTAGGTARAVLTLMQGGRVVSFDLGAATLTAFDIQAIFLGCGSQTGDGTTPDNFWKGDLRHFSYDHSALSILTMRDTCRYLAQQWGVPVHD